MNREELIQLCQMAVVHHTKWNNRDSYSAQKGLQSIYFGLTAGFNFRIVTKEVSSDYHSDDDTLIVEFLPPFDNIENAKPLKISSREDYFKDCDPEHETEMFDGEGIDFDSSFTKTFMPTKKRIENVGVGNDWY